MQEYCPAGTLPGWRDAEGRAGPTCTIATDADAARLVGNGRACEHLQARARGEVQ